MMAGAGGISLTSIAPWSAAGLGLAVAYALGISIVVGLITLIVTRIHADPQHRDKTVKYMRWRLVGIVCVVVFFAVLAIYVLAEVESVKKTVALLPAGATIAAGYFIRDRFNRYNDAVKSAWSHDDRLVGFVRIYCQLHLDGELKKYGYDFLKHFNRELERELEKTLSSADAEADAADVMKRITDELETNGDPLSAADMILDSALRHGMFSWLMSVRIQLKTDYRTTYKAIMRDPSRVDAAGISRTVRWGWLPWKH